MPITPSALALLASGVPGDTNNNGMVEVNEVQGAINMYLGLKAVQSAADLDGNGAVSSSELQKIINSFQGQ